MTCEQYILGFKETYQWIARPVDKPDYTIDRFRHRTLGRQVMLRRYSHTVPVYEKLTAVSSPYLPEVYDVITLEDGVIVLEEFIGGDTVADLAEAGRYNHRGVLEVVRTVCGALSVLHRCGIVHRDVKPENIMVTADGRVVLIDFNVSCLMSDAPQDVAVMGTLGYAPPEQMGLAPMTAQTDIYAVGVLLNVLTTGQHPSRQIAHGHIGRLVRKCTNINPEERFQTAEQLLKAL